MNMFRKALLVVTGFLFTLLGTEIDRLNGLVGSTALAGNETAQSGEKSSYKPPLRGAPTRRVGGATRGDGEDALYVTVLAPESTGLTSNESPALYWYVSRVPSRDVSFTLIRDDQIDPVAEAALPRPASGGIAMVSLEALDVRLEPGVTYEWSIALIKDPLNRSTDIVTSGTIRLVRPDAATSERLGRPNAEDRFAAFGEAGYWYDAIDLSSRAMTDGTTETDWRARRASYLEQEGLEKVVAHDRST